MVNFNVMKKQIVHMKRSGFTDKEISRKINIPIYVIKMLQKSAL